MKACEHRTWTDETTQFPEDFAWSVVTSIQVEKVARVIVEAIVADFKTEERALVGGLREALRIIARTVDVAPSAE